MYQLTMDKERILNEQVEKLTNAYTKMEDSVNRALKDSETSGSGDVSLLKVFKATVKLKWEKSLKMESKERLEFAKLEFDARRDAFNEIKEILKTSRESLIKDIDEQMEIARKAMEEIDKELKDVVDDAERKELIRTKEEHAARGT
jgi:hypothetical protein